MQPSFPFNPVAVNGVGSWYNPLTWSIVTGYNLDEQQAQGAALDASLQKLNDEAATTGQIDQATYDQTVQHLAQQIQDTGNIPTDVNQAFVDGALAGYQSELAVLEAIPEYAGKISGDVLNAITTGVGRGAGSILGAIPWWVWAAGATALFLHFGGTGYVTRRARGYLNEH